MAEGVWYVIIANISLSPSHPHTLTDILGDVESAVLLKAELEAADHTLSDEFFSRLETMTQSHSSESHSSIPILPILSFLHSRGEREAALEAIQLS